MRFKQTRKFCACLSWHGPRRTGYILLDAGEHQRTNIDFPLLVGEVYYLQIRPSSNFSTIFTQTRALGVSFLQENEISIKLGRSRPRVPELASMAHPKAISGGFHCPLYSALGCYRACCSRLLTVRLSRFRRFLQREYLQCHELGLQSASNRPYARTKPPVGCTAPRHHTT